MGADTSALVATVQVPGAPPPAGHYADATVMSGQIFVSGLLALDVDGRVAAQGAGAQAEHIFASLGRILDAAGSSLDDVAKLTLFLLDLDDRGAVNEVRKRVFGAHRPASTLVQVAGLIGDGTLLEIEAIAGLRKKS